MFVQRFPAVGVVGLGCWIIWETVFVVMGDEMFKKGCDGAHKVGTGTIEVNNSVDYHRAFDGTEIKSYLWQIA